MYILPQFVLNESRALGTRGPYREHTRGQSQSHAILLLKAVLYCITMWWSCHSLVGLYIEINPLIRKGFGQTYLGHKYKKLQSTRRRWPYQAGWPRYPLCPRSLLSPEPVPGLTPLAGNTSSSQQEDAWKRGRQASGILMGLGFPHHTRSRGPNGKGLQPDSGTSRHLRIWNYPVHRGLMRTGVGWMAASSKLMFTWNLWTWFYLEKRVLLMSLG